MSGNAQMDDPLIGRVIANKIELVSLLGQGAMGKVYRAHHRLLDKTVAIKVLLGDGAPGERQVARFVAEARAASRLEHPNSVTILDFGEDGDDRLLYIVMEFIEGRPLSKVLREQGPMDEARTCRIIAQVCSALGAAHDVGVIHRDVKPGNIMIVPRLGDSGTIEEHVKVCDFGIAKLEPSPDRAAPDEPLTLEGSLFGTPGYMAPEQVRGEALDGRADLYACGFVLYTMLAGRHPFNGKTPIEAATLTLHEDPEPIEHVRRLVSPAVSAIVARAIKKDRNARFADARAMQQALLQCVDDSLDAVEVAESPRSKAGLVLALAVTTAVVAGLVVAMRGQPDAIDVRPLAVRPDARDARDVQAPDVRPVGENPPDARKRVAVAVSGPPAGTEVFGPTGLLGTAPGLVDLERSTQAVTLTFRRSGYQSTSIRVIPSQDRTLDIRMMKATPKTKVAPKSEEPKGRSRDRLEDPFR